MGVKRIVGIDYGKSRCGVAATDTLRIAVHPLTSVSQQDLLTFLTSYTKAEEVEKIVFGWPTHTDGTPTALAEDIKHFVKQVEKKIPSVEIDFQDESYTSAQASKILAQTAKKKDRRSKTKLDVLSAVLILQRYLNHI